jgi:hypothetical protein
MSIPGLCTYEGLSRKHEHHGYYRLQDLRDKNTTYLCSSPNVGKVPTLRLQVPHHSSSVVNMYLHDRMSKDMRIVLTSKS